MNRVKLVPVKYAYAFLAHTLKTKELGGIVAENIGPLALYYESTLKACHYENRAVLKRRYESRALLIYCLLGPGGRGGFHTYRNLSTIMKRIFALARDRNATRTRRATNTPDEYFSARAPILGSATCSDELQLRARG